MSDADLSPRKAPSQQRSTQTVDRIVAAAISVFDDVGYQEATTNELHLLIAHGAPRTDELERELLTDRQHMAS